MASLGCSSWGKGSSVETKLQRVCWFWGNKKNKSLDVRLVLNESQEPAVEGVRLWNVVCSWQAISTAPGAQLWDWRKNECPEEAKKWIRNKSERRSSSRWSEMGRCIFVCLGDLSKYHYQGLSDQPLPLLFWLWRIKAWLPVIVCQCPTSEVL